MPADATPSKNIAAQFSVRTLNMQEPVLKGRAVGFSLRTKQTSEAETPADMPFMAGLTLAEFELLVPRGSAI